MRLAGILVTLLGVVSLALTVMGGDADNVDLQLEDLGENMEIVGFGDSCDEVGSFCDKLSGLTCNTEKVCECDRKHFFSFNESSQKCVDHRDQNDREYYDWSESVEVVNSYEDEEKSSEKDSDSPASLTSDDKSLSPDSNETKVNEVDSQSGENEEDEKDSEIKEASLDMQPEPALTNQSDSTAEGDSSDNVSQKNKDNSEDIAISMTGLLKGTPIDEYDSSVESLNKTSNTSEYDEDDDDASYEYHDFPQTPDVWAEDSLELALQKCKKDAECQILMGQHSRCLQETGECECFDTENTGKEVILINDTTCFVNFEIGDACKSHIECDAVIPGDAWCHSDLGTETTSCQCQPFHFWDAEWKECLPLGVQGLDSPCKSDSQCNSELALGQHSRCSEVTGLCECSNSLASEAKSLVFYELKCVQETDLNGTCTTDQDCEASLGPLAYCSAETLTCACIEENKCQKVNFRPRYSYDQPQLSGFSMIVVGFLAAGTLIAAFLCVALRKQNEYGFVTLENEV